MGAYLKKCIKYPVANSNPIPFDDQTVASFLSKPYKVHENALDTIELYGKSGKLPTVLSLDICFIVGIGDANNAKEATGASFAAKLTTTLVVIVVGRINGAIIAADDDDNKVGEVVDIAVAAAVAVEAAATCAAIDDDNDVNGFVNMI